MTSVALAFVAAVAWGAGDFLGGRASKLVSSTVVVWASGVMSIVVIGVAALVLGGADRGTALAWGFAGGVAVGLGGLVLYKGLAEGRMSVVAQPPAWSVRRCRWRSTWCGASGSLPPYGWVSHSP